MPFGTRAPRRPYFFRVLEELDHFLQLGLGFVDPGDVGEGDAGLLLDVNLGAALADRHEAAAEPAALARHAAHEPVPDAEEDERRTTHDSTSRRKVLSWTLVYLTPYLSSRSARSGCTRLATATVLPFSALSACR